MAAGVLALLFTASGLNCDPPLGIVSRDAFRTRYLTLSNRSHGYVVFRVSATDTAALVTPALPPGGETVQEMGQVFGTLCPERLVLEIFAFARAHPATPALLDETLLPAPYASARAELLPTRDFGCRADVNLVTLADTIRCTVWEVDESAQAIGFGLDEPSEATGFAAVSVPVQRQTGLQAPDPPDPRTPERFPLMGRVVNLNNEPIPNVEIDLADLGEHVATGSDGWFQVMRPSGEYLVEAVIPGVEVAPQRQRFTHLDPAEVPIEFIAHTLDVPQLSAPEE